ncbi:MAG TPA: methyltransferase domain-containing protein [Actinomycetota bacterium]|nr:methyltransferase domain-containing protein [Actinomycetota bacterium]
MFLAKKRAAMADKLIDESQRTGSILDLGCGTTPYFLIKTRFSEKAGVEKRPVHMPEGAHVRATVHDIEKPQSLPFEDGSFEVVTMLAVLEHLDPKRLIGLLDEIHRLLRPGGTVILTTPASWTDPILAVMARLGLVSHEEIDEHHQTHTHRSLRELFSRSRFGNAHLQLGRFELGMNLWAKAQKP